MIKRTKVAMLATNPFVAGELSLMNITMKTMPATINKVSTVIRKSGQCRFSSVVPMSFSLLARRGLCLIIAARITRATAAHTAPTASLNSSCRSTCQRSRPYGCGRGVSAALKKAVCLPFILNAGYSGEGAEAHERPGQSVPETFQF